MLRVVKYTILLNHKIYKEIPVNRDDKSETPTGVGVLADAVHLAASKPNSKVSIEIEVA